jgi:hypothetical protein
MAPAVERTLSASSYATLMLLLVEVLESRHGCYANQDAAKEIGYAELAAKNRHENRCDP